MRSMQRFQTVVGQQLVQVVTAVTGPLNLETQLKFEVGQEAGLW